MGGVGKSDHAILLEDISVDGTVHADIFEERFRAAEAICEPVVARVVGIPNAIEDVLHVCYTPAVVEAGED